MNSNLVENINCFIVIGVLLLAVISLSKSPVAKWQKPTAQKVDFKTIEVTGDAKEIQQIGTPGAKTWTHIGYKKWRVETSRPDDAVDAINHWDGRLQ